MSSRRRSLPPSSSVTKRTFAPSNCAPARSGAATLPRTDYGADWAASPNRITLFRLPLQEDFPDPRDLEAEVRLTVLHELAHHLGIDDDRLDELGAG